MVTRLYKLSYFYHYTLAFIFSLQLVKASKTCHLSPQINTYFEMAEKLLIIFKQERCQTSRQTVSGENAGKHTAMYSAPWLSGELYCIHSLAFTITAWPA